VRITFTPDSIEEIARVACELNQEMENIGARRLHTIMEKVLEEISFNLPDVDTKEIIIDRGYVRNKILKIVKNKDLSKYIL
jgi:ATP-dependent HslUV protease ATP-binding subunit HslU